MQSQTIQTMVVRTFSFKIRRENPQGARRRQLSMPWRLQNRSSKTQSAWTMIASQKSHSHSHNNNNKSSICEHVMIQPRRERLIVLSKQNVGTMKVGKNIFVGLVSGANEIVTQHWNYWSAARGCSCMLYSIRSRWGTRQRRTT